MMFLSIVLIWILREQFLDNGRMRAVIDLKHKNSTLLGRLISFGLDPIRCAVTKANIADKYRQGESGVIESLQHLLVSENYIKPWSAEHSLVTLLTSCF